MTLIIKKLPLDLTNGQVQLNEGARVLTGIIDEIDGPVIFVLLDENQPIIQKTFKVVPTNLKDENLQSYSYLLTFFGSGYAWHLFDTKESA